MGQNSEKNGYVVCAWPLPSTDYEVYLCMGPICMHLFCSACANLLKTFNTAHYNIKMMKNNLAVYMLKNKFKKLF